MGNSVVKKIVVVLMCFAMATPLFYSMAGGGGQAGPAGGIDAVALEKSMRDRVRKLLGTPVDRDLVLKWSKCLADGLVAWVDQSGCAKESDPNRRDQCMASAGIEAAQEDVFKTCADTHAPKTWSGLRGAVLGEVKRFLTAQKIPAVKLAPLSKCITDGAISTLDKGDCPPKAIFDTEGCFSAEVRATVYATAYQSCQATAAPDTAAPASDSPK